MVEATEFKIVVSRGIEITAGTGLVYDGFFLINFKAALTALVIWSFSVFGSFAFCSARIFYYYFSFSILI